MSAKILDGRVVASHLWRELSVRVKALEDAGGRRPRLAMVRFDERRPSAVYAASLARAARSVGIETLEVVPPDGVSSPTSQRASAPSIAIRRSPASWWPSRYPPTWTRRPCLS